MSAGITDSQLWSVVVRCVHGLEWVCADEVATTVRGADQVRTSRREVTLRLPGLDPALLALRTADDVFLEVGEVPAVGSGRDAPDVIGAAAARLPWEECLRELGAVRPLPHAPVLDIVASVEGKHRFNRFDVERAIGARLAQQLGGEYLRRTAAGRDEGDPDVAVRVFVRPHTVSIAVRLAAEPLHRRAYKSSTGPGTLHPPVAAAMIRIMDPRPGSTMLDPFCGDGTLLIEAALAVDGIVATGWDIDPQRVLNARKNSGRAGAPIRVDVVDAGLGELTGLVDAVATNPPWNVAVESTGSLRTSLLPMWDRLPARLVPDGRLVLIADADLHVDRALAASGYRIGLVNPIRVAGRVSELVIAAPPGAAAPALSEPMLAWRSRAAESAVL